jgi:predicted O-linked N-acetylglucosamine transferase (SPINDLY family)
MFAADCTRDASPSLMLGKILKILGGDKRSAETSRTVEENPDGLADQLIAEGNRAEEAGDLRVACERYRRAVQVAPRYANAHLNLGIGLEAAGDAEQACKSYRAVLDIDPSNPYANYNLGRHLFSLNAPTQAEPLLRRAIDSNPRFPEARVVLSRLLEQGGDTAAAASELELALRDRPDYFGALSNYADLLLKLDRRGEAESALRRAAALQPGDFNTNYKLARLLVDSGQPVDAEKYFSNALRSNPDSVDVLASLVNLHLAGGQLEAAARAAEAALKLRPDWLELLFNYGLILKRQTRNADAESVFRRMIAIDPAFAPAYQMLGAVLVSQCRLRDALDLLGEGRKHCPDAFDLESAELFALNCTEEISVGELYLRHAEYGKRLERHEPTRFEFFGTVRDPRRRLRVGYISPDFKRHVVPQFLLPLLEERDKSSVAIYCYSTGDTADEFTERVRAQSDVWHAAGRMSADQVADMIHRDRIDVLVDLTGHSSAPNLQVFAQGPAPVQVTWLGYLNTSGLTRMHYRLTDNYCDPPGLTDGYHTEKLVRLPRTQWCYRPFIEVDCEKEAPVQRNGYITFGSFNHAMKITGTARKLWGEILRKLPESRLLVVGIADGRARENFHRDLEQSGVDGGRITTLPYVSPEEYFRWFGKVDIALDTMPFSGGTTTCDALWMGVPVVTVPGVRSWSRSAGSVLTNLGLDDWIAESQEDYVRRAVQFAAKPPVICELRMSLRSRMLRSPVMDKRQFARDMDDAYRRMWHSWCEQPGGRGC